VKKCKTIIHESIKIFNFLITITKTLDIKKIIKANESATRFSVRKNLKIFLSSFLITIKEMKSHKKDCIKLKNVHHKYIKRIQKYTQR